MLRSHRFWVIGGLALLALALSACAGYPTAKPPEPTYTPLPPAPTEPPATATAPIPTAAPAPPTATPVPPTHTAAATSGTPSEKPVGDADAGAKVYAENCAACHGPEGKGAIGPSLRGLTDDAAALETIIRQGKKGDQLNMPAFDSRLSDADIQNLIALLQAWRK